MTDLRALQLDVHRIAVEKGWWDDPPSFLPKVALMHSELSEAVEAWREGPSLDGTAATIPSPFYEGKDGKPEGWATELADCVIRILDTCEHYGVDLNELLSIKMAYNRTRPYRHGGKRA